MKNMKTMIVLFIIIQLILLSTLLIPFLFNVYVIVSVSLLITYISWQSLNVITRYLLPNKSIESKGRSVLITGCDSGFGYSTAIDLHEKGWHVFACVLSNDSDGALDLKSRGCQTIKLNVTNDSDVLNAYNVVLRECSSRQLKLWAIINNAGVYMCGEIEWGFIEDYEKVFQINVLGYIRIIRRFLPLIRKSRGRIINVSSVASVFTAPGTTIYSMSKSAITSLTDGLRRELCNTGIAVIEIIPQAYKTSMTRAVLDGLDQCWKQTPFDIKNDFGEQYYNKFRLYLGQNLNRARDKPYEVVNTIVNSVTLERVNYKYLCCGLIDRLIMWSFNWMPIELLDPIVSLFTVKEKPIWALK